MISKKTIFASVATCSFIALALAQSSSSVLGSYQAALAKAPTLETTYVLSSLGGATTNYAVTLKKPNKAIVDTPTTLYVADGKTLTTFQKAEKVYSTEAQTSANLMGLFHGEALRLWAGFFDETALKSSTARDVKARDRNGESFPGFEMSSEGKKVTAFVSSADNIVRQAAFDALSDARSAGTPAATLVLNTRSVVVGADVSDGRFAFKAPQNAKEVSSAELNSAKWIYNLEEAKKVAAQTNRKIFVDFMADWCGPCKKLDAEVFVTNKFKKYSSKLVFLKIDVDRQRPVSEAYKIEAMPTQMVLSKDGAVLSSTVGYGNPSAFYQWLDGALGGQ
jgi:thiol-disulfide isomerase/thioredoxin